MLQHFADLCGYSQNEPNPTSDRMCFSSCDVVVQGRIQRTLEALGTQTPQASSYGAACELFSSAKCFNAFGPL